MSFSILTLYVTKTLSKRENKQYGFFVTPPVINTIIERIQRENPIIQSILEPSCGTGEFISACQKAFPEVPDTHMCHL